MSAAAPEAAGPRGREASVSVIVPFYRAQQDLDRLVAALTAQTHPAARTQLVVADDGSPVPPALPADLPFDVVTVRHEDRGFRASAARALGVAAADGEVLAFLDGDMLPEPGYLAAALDAVAAEAPGEAVVVGRRRHADEAWLARAWAAGWRPGAQVPGPALLEEPAWLRDAYRHTEGLRRADSTGYRFVISAVLTVARGVYEDAGGFDPGFVGYGGEDWELAHRLWRAGGALRHEPRAVAWQAGADFGAREDPVRARRTKNREALVLAPRISAPTARGSALGLAGAGLAPHARVGVRLRADGDAGGPGDAAVVLGVDAVLRAAPGARVEVAGAVGPEAAACLTDPRVRVVGPALEADAAAPPGAAALRTAPDWHGDVLTPLRPAGAARPDPRAAEAWLLGLERAGVERVEVLGERPEAPVVAVLTCVRAGWRVHRDGDAHRVRTLRVPAARLGWRTVEAEPDLEAWWGGWG